MFILWHKTVFLIILVSIVFVFASDEERAKIEGICAVTRGVLCVKQVLEEIATSAKSINRTANEIEQSIINEGSIFDRILAHVKMDTDLIRSQLPTSRYHEQFIESNNIDQKYLVDLLLEAHDALSFYYNSIKDLVNINDVGSSETDLQFKQLQLNLSSEIICRYRSVLDVYSQEWPLIHQIKRIRFPQRMYRNAPSVDHDVHSIVIARLLSQWMERVHSVIINLGNKFD